MMVQGVGRPIPIVKETSKNQVSDAALALPSDFSPSGVQTITACSLTLCYTSFWSYSATSAHNYFVEFRCDNCDALCLLLQYEEKIFVRKTKRSHQPFPVSQQMSESIRANNKRAVYRLIVCSGADVNAVHQESSTSFLINKLKNSNENSSANNSDSVGAESVDRGPESAGRGAASSLSTVTKGKDSSGEDSLNGSSLLHLACQFADIGMVELLLQYGADMNAVDLRGQTPLHHCITRQKADMAKLLIMRGANTKVLDKEGKSAMELAEESELDDDELLALLRDNSG